MDFLSSFVAKADLQRANYSYFSTDPMKNNCSFANKGREAYLVLVVAMVSSDLAELQVQWLLCK